MRAQTTRRSPARLAAAVPLVLVVAIGACGQSVDEPDVSAPTDRRAGQIEIRGEPSEQAQRVGELASDARIEILEIDASGRWGRVLRPEAEQDGWVDLGRLGPLPLPTLADTVLPMGLTCRGTEPFWLLRVSSADKLRLEMLGEDEPLEGNIVAVRRSANSARYPVAVFADGDGRALRATVSAEQCSDGMSDHRYGWTVDVTWQSKESAALLSGCCSVSIER